MSDRIGRISLSTILAGLAPPTRPYVVTTLAVGPLGQSMHDVSGPVIRQYAERIGADYRPLVHPSHADYPHGFKFALRRVVEQWERTLYLDADVILSADCPDLFKEVPAGAIGIHDDYPHIPNPEWVDKEYAAINASQDWPDCRPPMTLNTGVIVCSRGHTSIFDRPTRPIPISGTAEQSVINLNILRAGLPVYYLPRVLNWQWWIDQAFRHTQDVKVWHLASCPRRVDLMRLLASGRAGDVPCEALVRGIYPMCKNEGAVIRPCNSCSGESRHVRECDVHGECTRGRVSLAIRSCLDCSDYQIWDPRK